MPCTRGRKSYGCPFFLKRPRPGSVDGCSTAAALGRISARGCGTYRDGPCALRCGHERKPVQRVHHAQANQSRPLQRSSKIVRTGGPSPLSGNPLLLERWIAAHAQAKMLDSKGILEAAHDAVAGCHKGDPQGHLASGAVPGCVAPQAPPRRPLDFSPWPAPRPTKIQVRLASLQHRVRLFPKTSCLQMGWLGSVLQR